MVSEGSLGWINLVTQRRMFSGTVALGFFTWLLIERNSFSFKSCFFPDLYFCVCVLRWVRLFATPWTLACQVPLSREFSRQEYWNGSHSLLQGIFPTQGLNPGLLYCRKILYHLSHQEVQKEQEKYFNIKQTCRMLNWAKGKKATHKIHVHVVNTWEGIYTSENHGAGIVEGYRKTFLISKLSSVEVWALWLQFRKEKGVFQEPTYTDCSLWVSPKKTKKEQEDSPSRRNHLPSQGALNLNPNPTCSVSRDSRQGAHAFSHPRAGERERVIFLEGTHQHR